MNAGAISRRWRELGATAQGLALFLVALAVVGPWLPVALLTVLVLLLIYASWAYSINLITGLTGYVSFGHVVFVGVGAYTLGFLIDTWKVDPLVGVAAGGLVGAALAGGIGVVTLRLRGVYFAIATLVTPLAAYHIISATPALGGGAGLFLNLGFRTLAQYYTLWVLLGAEIGVTWWVTRGRLGAGIRALRDDEDAAAAVGINVPRLKLELYMVSGFFAGAAGSVLGWYLSGVFPQASFDLGLSLLMLAMIVVGGMGTLLGPILGAILVYIPYQLLLRVLPQGQAIVIGVVVIVVALFVPQGIVGTIRRYLPEARGFIE
ncbi:MAG TPA: branched-chain amino acid ABC transporter permease [Thermoplasmata archaeon]|nr:branched-chain amino acid ABC transporter permease [Thermoplasmata archaeon]